MTTPLTCFAYPANSRQKAEGRANASAREQGWRVLRWDWYPDDTRLWGRESGVLVVRFDAVPQVPSSLGASRGAFTLAT